jgi:hypothetical protein
MSFHSSLFLISLLLISNVFAGKLKTSMERENTETNYYSKDAKKYLSKPDITCDETNCPAPNYCSTNKQTCFCEKGLANYPFTGVNDVYCQYEQHKQLTSFLLELFLNLGIGHFIIGQNLMGSFKLVIMLVPFILLILGKFNVVKFGFKEGNVGTTFAIIANAFGVGAFAWWLTDAIKFGLNKYRDRNEVPLAKW